MELSPWMLDLVNQYGFWALMVISFISATILPFSSMATLVVGIAAGIPVVPAVVASSIGNCAGCTFNYGMGMVIGKPLLPRMERKKSGIIAHRWVRKYGKVALLISWIPILGDPITIIAGIFRMNFVIFATIVFSIRIALYIIIALFMV